jgi:hypothetical protein
MKTKGKKYRYVQDKDGKIIAEEVRPANEIPLQKSPAIIIHGDHFNRLGVSGGRTR